MRREGLGVGIFFLAAGVLFLLDALEALDLRAEFLLPLLLVGFGIALIASGREPAPAEEGDHERPRAEEGDHPRAEEGDHERPPPPPPPTDYPAETDEADEEP